MSNYQTPIELLTWNYEEVKPSGSEHPLIVQKA